jgi:hypothetical protein
MITKTKKKSQPKKDHSLPKVVPVPTRQQSRPRVPKDDNTNAKPSTKKKMELLLVVAIPERIDAATHESLLLLLSSWTIEVPKREQPSSLYVFVIQHRRQHLLLRPLS